MFKSPAKINLFLEIVGRCTHTNYHYIHSLFLPVYSLYDTIEIVENERYDIVYVDRNKLNIGSTISNDIIAKTVTVLENKYGTIKKNYKLTITKNIPIGSGLGGGSSNAAIILQYLIEQNDLDVEKNDLITVAKEIGADVPFFLLMRPMICTGFGEIMHDPEFDIPKNLKIEIVTSDISVITANVFQVFANSNPTYTKYVPVQTFEDAISRQNDLLNIALQIEPRMQDFIDKIKQNDRNYLKVGMSGSGSACFGITLSNNE